MTHFRNTTSTWLSLLLILTFFAVGCGGSGGLGADDDEGPDDLGLSSVEINLDGMTENLTGIGSFSVYDTTLIVPISSTEDSLISYNYFTATIVFTSSAQTIGTFAIVITNYSGVGTYTYLSEEEEDEVVIVAYAYSNNNGASVTSCTSNVPTEVIITRDNGGVLEGRFSYNCDSDETGDETSGTFVIRAD